MSLIRPGFLQKYVDRFLPQFEIRESTVARQARLRRTERQFRQQLVMRAHIEQTTLKKRR